MTDLLSHKHVLQAIASPLHNAADLDPLMDQIGEARLVLIGEASHGTSDFYLWRARLTKRLVDEKGFSFVAVEGDWPDCYQVNRFVKGYKDAGTSAYAVLQAFERWPTWMWANWEVAAFITWLRERNGHREHQVGFYGLDVYSLWESMAAVIEYLLEHDPDAVETARQAYMCFEPYRGDVQEYAWSTTLVPETCESEVVQLLAEMRGRAAEFPDDCEAAFSAEQNARVLVNAERYYRAMVRSDVSSWNIRDEHMTDVLNNLLDFHGPESRAVVWEHNTHIGDARATDMAQRGEVNIGQLAREQHGEDRVVLVGFSTYRGSVIAGEHWGAPMERMIVPDARADSWEGVLHAALGGDYVLLLPAARRERALMQQRGHRAIGVVYRPHLDRLGNYVPTVLPLRYDALIYLDETEALHPFHLAPDDTETPPATYPWGM